MKALVFLMFALFLLADKGGTHGISIFCDSQSMYPAFTCNNRLTLQTVQVNDQAKLKVGDIVFYSPSPEQRFAGKQLGFYPKDMLIHRITNITQQSLILKGDANDFYDNDYFGDIKPYQIRYIVRSINGIDL
jgi:hypothetical protein